MACLAGSRPPWRARQESPGHSHLRRLDLQRRKRRNDRHRAALEIPISLYASVFKYYGNAIEDGIEPLAFCGVTLAACALAALGAWLFERRDLAA
jgi:hypothetical protein